MTAILILCGISSFLMFILFFIVPARDRAARKALNVQGSVASTTRQSSPIGLRERAGAA